MKNRKQAAAREYISIVCLFSKVLAGYMFFKTNSTYGIIFGVFCLIQMVVFPEPIYTGPEKITYFRGPHLEEELQRDKRITWVVTFFASWSPPCVILSPIFAELSNDYSLDNLKFGKIDVSKFPDVGRYTIFKSKSLMMASLTKLYLTTVPLGEINGFLISSWPSVKSMIVGNCFEKDPPSVLNLFPTSGNFDTSIFPNFKLSRL
jgi:thiol-disulfide isomerase/thioredoxin